MYLEGFCVASVRNSEKAGGTDGVGGGLGMVRKGRWDLVVVVVRIRKMGAQWGMGAGGGGGGGSGIGGMGPGGGMLNGGVSGLVAKGGSLAYGSAPLVVKVVLVMVVGVGSWGNSHVVCAAVTFFSCSY